MAPCVAGDNQGGESRDLFGLFCTCIRTGQVRKLFIISLILNAFSCGEMHIPYLCNQQRNIEVFYVCPLSFQHNLEQRQNVFARGCLENYSVHGHIS